MIAPLLAMLVQQFIRMSISAWRLIPLDGLVVLIFQIVLPLKCDDVLGRSSRGVFLSIVFLNGWEPEFVVGVVLVHDGSIGINFICKSTTFHRRIMQNDWG